MRGYTKSENKNPYTSTNFSNFHVNIIMQRELRDMKEGS